MITAEVKGLEKVLQKLGPDLIAEPLRDFLNKAGQHVQSEAKERAPVDTGRLRSSITTEVDDGLPPLWAKVGSNVDYAPYMEYGTGGQSDGSGGRGGRHWPPAGALDVWARRHGFQSGFQVAKAIGQRGGLEPRRYLRGALEDSVAKLKGFVKDMAKDIERMWGK